MSQIATLVFLCGIAVLFHLNRDRKAHTSGAFWLPVLWLGVNGSRSVSQWLAIFGLGGGASLTPDQYLDGSPLDRNFYLVFTLIGIAVLASRPKVAKILRANNMVLLFFAYCMVSAIWSDFPDVTFKRWFKAVGDLVMVLIILTERDQETATKRLFTRTGFVLLPLSVLFIRYFPALGRDFHPAGAGAAWQAAYTGVTTSKNLLGMITLLLGIGLEWCFIETLRERKITGKRVPWIAQAISLATVVYIMNLAKSATAMSCILMGAGMVALSLFKFGRKPKIVTTYLVATVSISLFALFADAGGGLLGTVGRDASLTGRTDIWKLALGMSGNPLVGTGFESFWLGARVEKTWNHFRFHLQESHNGYLEIYLTLGWIGVVLLAGLIVVGYRNALAAFRRNPRMGSLRFAFFLVALVYNVTEVGFRMQNPIWMLFLWAIIDVPAPVISDRGSPGRTTAAGRIEAEVPAHVVLGTRIPEGLI